MKKVEGVMGKGETWAPKVFVGVFTALIISVFSTSPADAWWSWTPSSQIQSSHDKITKAGIDLVRDKLTNPYLKSNLDAIEGYTYTITYDVQAHGDDGDRNGGDIPSYWNLFGVSYNHNLDDAANIYLGRCIHLIEDMSVPAHAYNIKHAGLDRSALLDRFESEASIHSPNVNGIQITPPDLLHMDNPARYYDEARQNTKYAVESFGFTGDYHTGNHGGVYANWKGDGFKGYYTVESGIENELLDFDLFPRLDLVGGAVFVQYQMNEAAKNVAKFLLAVDKYLQSPPVPTGMVLIPAGSFQMGDAIDGMGEAMPVHTVTLSAFNLDKYEVTKALWDEVYTWATAHGYGFEDYWIGTAANHPVRAVSWYDVVKWLNARSEKEGLTPVYYTDSGQAAVYRTGRVNVADGAVKWSTNGYRLPTEAEWEYAARGGTTTRFYTGNCISTDQANYDGYYYPAGCPAGQYRAGTTVVGNFPANPWGLYDMAGNVSEWTWDWYGTYSSSAVTNPRGPASGSSRVFRGGGYFNFWQPIRSANRDGGDPAFTDWPLGFRSALNFATVGSCTYRLSPYADGFAATSALGVVTVTSSSSGCSWTASSNANWITITAGSAGTGNGTVSYSVSANTGTSTRSGTMTIAGQTFTITQSSPITYLLTASKTGNGTITSSPAGISCGTDCTEIYNSGTSVTLTTTPDSGWSFTCWGGACSGTGSCQVTMGQANNVKATFTPLRRLDVVKAGTGTGTFTGSPLGISSDINCGTACLYDSADYIINTAVTLTAAPDAGYAFTGWSGGGCSGTGLCVVTMSAAATVTATFLSSALKGDLNGDATVSLADAILSLRAMGGLNPTGLRADYTTSGVDVNGDRKIGMADLIYILQKVSGLR